MFIPLDFSGPKAQSLAKRAASSDGKADRIENAVVGAFVGLFGLIILCWFYANWRVRQQEEAAQRAQQAQTERETSRQRLGAVPGISTPERARVRDQRPNIEISMNPAFDESNFDRRAPTLWGKQYRSTETLLRYEGPPAHTEK